ASSRSAACCSAPSAIGSAFRRRSLRAAWWSWWRAPRRSCGRRGWSASCRRQWKRSRDETVRSGGAGECRGGPLLHLLRRDVLAMRRDAPTVPRRVLHAAEAVAPEHVLDRHEDLGARLDGLGERLVDVGDAEEQQRRLRRLLE